MTTINTCTECGSVTGVVKVVEHNKATNTKRVSHYCSHCKPNLHIKSK